MILPIVGSKFHPPANAILSFIPVGQELELHLDKENEHTTEEFPNAIAVWIDGREIKQEVTDQAEANFAGYGYSSDDILSEYWHLGFIPKESAKDIHLSGPIRGRFAIGSNGGPRVEFQL
jgi:hypothetical protein